MNTFVELLQKKDLDQYLTLVTAIDRESPFMDYNDGERDGKESKILNRYGDPDSLYFVVKRDDELAGYFEIHGFKTAKKKHMAYTVCGILAKHYGSGVGFFLSQTALQEASKRWRKLEMSVVEGNESCLKLAAKHGFKQEGFREKSILMQEQYYGEFLMGLHFVRGA